jgi:hypothetical protein
MPSVETDAPGPSGLTFGGSMQLLLPPLTDIRDNLCLTGSDAVEVPLGSGRWYLVVFVDDFGKGFANEHRGAMIVKPPSGAPLWPSPIP